MGIKKELKAVQAQLDAANTLVQRYRLEQVQTDKDLDQKQREVLDLKHEKENLLNDVKTQEEFITMKTVFIETILKIIIGPSEDKSKVQAIRDLLQDEIEMLTLQEPPRRRRFKPLLVQIPGPRREYGF